MKKTKALFSTNAAVEDMSSHGTSPHRHVQRSIPRCGSCRNRPRPWPRRSFRGRRGSCGSCTDNLWKLWSSHAAEVVQITCILHSNFCKDKSNCHHKSTRWIEQWWFRFLYTPFSFQSRTTFLIIYKTLLTILLR